MLSITCENIPTTHQTHHSRKDAISIKFYFAQSSKNKQPNMMCLRGLSTLHQGHTH